MSECRLCIPIKLLFKKNIACIYYCDFEILDLNAVLILRFREKSCLINITYLKMQV